MASRITSRKLFVCLMLTRLIIDFPQAQPTVHEDGRIGFELHAPSAGKVLLTGLGDRAPIPMTRDEEGLWSVTVGPLEPDLYSYHFLVDGALTIDPKNRAVKKWRTLASMVEVPGVNLASLHA